MTLAARYRMDVQRARAQGRFAHIMARTAASLAAQLFAPAGAEMYMLKYRDGSVFFMPMDPRPWRL